MTYAQNARGMDKASAVDYPTAVAQGSHYFGRYSAAAATSPSNSSHQLNAPKLCQPGEIARIVAAGGDFIALDEWYTTRTIEGAASAEQDAPVTLAYWRSMGLAPGSTVHLNLDAGYVPTELGGIEAYYDRTNLIYGGEYLADGFYGPLAPAMGLVQSGRIKHHIIPEAASWTAPKQTLQSLGINAPPAVTTWDLWQPTATQFSPAFSYLLGLCAPLIVAGIESIIWQDGNKTPTGGDEDVVLVAGKIGSHLEAAGVSPTPPPVPPVIPPHPTAGPHQGLAWPGATLHFGTKDHFGNINGNAQSHGGYYADEQPWVAAIQDRLLWLNCVAGHSYPNSAWANGQYDDKGAGTNPGPTSQAVNLWHQRYYPHQPDMYDIYQDDWVRLFSQTK